MPSGREPGIVADGPPGERERMHLHAAGALPRSEADDELEAVEVVLGEREDEAERRPGGADRLEIADGARERSPAAPDRRRGPSGVPSIEIARTSTSGASGSQRAGVRSMPFEVTVVTIPSARARASSSGSGR